ncbi:glucose-6-phosphate/phosphate-tranlocation protein, putative [Trichomonas vaginalis G3]|uniref:Glucose-6-phosphate/phosphate-tranlocation protein, putative n=1 Tax=Trichomonas vaginalis (strain ATCC PRA-98 / G3) TaxID=412133 RepID=A2F6F0_TRIV3|nr:carbohydrate transport [Trichomonas vaginalis G3]EAX99508.1 glucose-6-phosphate/phosphate-tranlocation protein, putative [Trichomonas vaginalis G3]KAI5535642.1 carbohydrate transport [Trichomonas vaginalis G3]|eukprot:XP_001312438.1 glucose-6-phosphate/phosphate-tranlocation protein [Trichomonas vaginalis G3]
MELSVLAWLISSIVFSTAIITVNKSLTRLYHFTYMGTLTSIHFLCTYIILTIMQKLNIIESAKDFPITRRWLLALWGVGSVVFMNLNLATNSVGFYQLSKMCTIPALVIFNYIALKKTTPLNTLFSLTILLIGVYLYSVNDVEANTTGTIFAVLAIIATTGFQAKSNLEQKNYGISGPACQHATALPQFVLSSISAVSTEFFGINTILEHKFTRNEIITIIVSCLLAVGVNVSFFALVGKTSPITYQVVGHLKTILILIFGIVLFPPEQKVERAQFYKTLLGIAISMVGIILYSIFQHLNKPPPPPEEQKGFLEDRKKDEEQKGFLDDIKSETENKQ